MMIFEEPGTALMVGLILAAAFFAVQLLLCYRAKKPVVKWIPTCLILFFGLLILLIGMGVFGEGGGFLGNVHWIVAAILAMVGGAASIGVLAAWIVYRIDRRKKKGI